MKSDILLENSKKEYEKIFSALKDKKNSNNQTETNEYYLELEKELQKQSDIFWQWDFKNDSFHWSTPAIQAKSSLSFANFLQLIFSGDKKKLIDGLKIGIEGAKSQSLLLRIKVNKKIYSYRLRAEKIMQGNKELLVGSLVKTDAEEGQRLQKSLTTSKFRNNKLEAAYRALLETEHRFHIEGKSLSYGIWMADKKGNTTYVSDAFLELVGMTLEECQQMGWTRALPPETVEPLMQHWLYCVEKGCFWETEYQVLGPDNKYHTILTRGLPYRDSKGNIQGWVGINIGIDERKRLEEEIENAKKELEKDMVERTAQLVATNKELMLEVAERKKIEESLRELTGHLDMALQAARMGTWIWNVREDTVIWDKYILQMFGLSQDKNVRTYDEFIECLHPEDREVVRRDGKLAVIKKQGGYFEYRIIWPDGSVRVIATRGEIYCDANDGPIRMTGICWDITERKKAEEWFYQHQHQLANVHRINSMGEMASTLAHELNQPLAAIANYAQGCVRRIKSNTYQVQELLYAMQQAAQQAERAGEIIHRMKNFVSKGKLFKEKIHINELLENVAASMHHENLELLAVEMKLGENLPEIEIDKIQIQQVVLNLLRNAIEAMQEAKTSRPKIVITSSLLANNVIEVCISDNGPGFPEDFSRQLVVPYFTTKPKGMGIGLAICRTIIEGHGGSLQANLNPQGGACFQFRLPVGA